MSCYIRCTTYQGGFVATSASVEALATLSPEVQICDFAVLKRAVKVLDRAIVSGRANLAGNIAISGDAKVDGDANLINSDFGGDMLVMDDAQIYGNAYLNGNIIVSGSSRIYGNAKIQDFVEIHGASLVCGNAILNENIVLTDDTSNCTAK